MYVRLESPGNPVTSVLSRDAHSNKNMRGGRNKLDRSKFKGALAGIVVGSVVLLAAIAAAIYLVVKLYHPNIAQSFTPSSAMQSPLA